MRIVEKEGQNDLPMAPIQTKGVFHCTADLEDTIFVAVECKQASWALSLSTFDCIQESFYTANFVKGKLVSAKTHVAEQMASTAQAEAVGYSTGEKRVFDLEACVTARIWEVTVLHVATTKIVFANESVKLIHRAGVV